jgi:hypothetical protein
VRTSPGTKVRGKLSYQGRGCHTRESTQDLDGMISKHLFRYSKILTRGYRRYAVKSGLSLDGMKVKSLTARVIKSSLILPRTSVPRLVMNSDILVNLLLCIFLTHLLFLLLYITYFALSATVMHNSLIGGIMVVPLP